MRWMIAITVFAMCGCKSDPTAAEGGDRPAPKTEAVRDVVAIVDGRPIGAAEMQPLMIEATGGIVLRDVILDRLLAERLEEKKLAVSREEIEYEKQLFLAQLSVDKDQAARLLTQLRERSGLGPRRFELLLRRNAMLRKLVAGGVQINDGMVKQLYDERYGEQTICRLILVDTLNEATRVMERVKAGEPFEELAKKVSKDRSREQGGLIPPIAPGDATYPASVREVAGKLEAAQVSDPVAIEDGFAILKCERKIAAQSIPLEQVAEELRGLAKVRQEQMLMQREARTMLQAADVTVLDAELNHTFTRIRSETVEPK